MPGTPWASHSPCPGARCPGLGVPTSVCLLVPPFPQPRSHTGLPEDVHGQGAARLDSAGWWPECGSQLRHAFISCVMPDTFLWVSVPQFLMCKIQRVIVPIPYLVNVPKTPGTVPGINTCSSSVCHHEHRNYPQGRVPVPFPALRPVTAALPEEFFLGSVSP